MKPGSSISFSVQRKIGDHSWVVRMLGREVRVVSNLQLEVGARLKATVQLESGKLLLRIDRQAHALNNILQTSNLPDTQTSRMLIHAFIAQGLPLREERLRAALKLFSQLEVKDSATSRLLAIAYDKGLFLTPEQMKRLQLLVFGGEYGRREGSSAQPEQQDSGPGHSPNEQSSGREQSQERQGQQRQDQADQHKRGYNPKLIEKDLHTQITSRGSEASLLHLFNHIQANHKNWIIIPLSFKPMPAAEAPAEEDSGVLRLELDPDGRPQQFTLTFKLYREPEPSIWHFAGKITKPESKIHIYRGNREQGRPNAEILSRLHKKLNNLSFEIDDTIREASEFDPFGMEDISLLKRVDTTA
ncbi:MAG: hypothetical protein R6V86_08595 [Spirochaetia bacterium]